MPILNPEGRVPNRPSWPDDVNLNLLKALVIRLMQFAMIFGGFGQSWR